MFNYQWFKDLKPKRRRFFGDHPFIYMYIVYLYMLRYIHIFREKDASDLRYTELISDIIQRAEVSI